MKEARRRTCAVAAAVLAAAVTAGGCGAAPARSVNSRAAEARSADDFGGMDGLVRAAKKEGSLNVYALAPTWANYRTMIDTFEKKYGIEVHNEDPGGSSQGVLNAAVKRQGQTRAVDAMDLGGSFMRAAKGKRVLAPYKVRDWRRIPARMRQRDGSYQSNYGGYVSIGCDAKAVKRCPTTFRELLRPAYRNKVALNGNPNESTSAFGAVIAAALANGGGFDDVRPGLEFFKELKQRGNFLPVESTKATVQKGETPISIDWDYLNLGYAEELRSKGVDWKVAVPSDGAYSEFYNQGVNAFAPHPAAARLWMEFLYSEEGQNIWLRGFSRPALLDPMRRDGTADARAVKRLPEVAGPPRFPTADQQTEAQKAVSEGWGAAVS
ncbi:extracellular solute-binding protein [Streptomyces sp. ODS28]|uniref:ABC transporter substrate-binding protein n=1 Tax=Streptomyces sp. ODS28 TaxID=3136688 RepID=UPI0031EA0F3B